MSAIQDDKSEPIKVLFVLHDGFDTLDFCGPLEMFSHARHNIKDPSTKAFTFQIAAASQGVKSAQGATFKADMDFDDAHEDIEDFDILVVPGGGVEPILQANAEPMSLIKSYVELQKKDPSKERTLFSVCTGSLFLAKAGVLQGLAATTHPDYYTKFENMCVEASKLGDLERTDVMEERYVVNNARFDLGEDLDSNPFILDKKPDLSNPQARRKSIARKGSDAFKLSKRRESLVKRQNMKLGGLRVITSGGVAAGMDATLYLVAAMVSIEAAHEVARVTQYTWAKGVTVEGVDV
ncbi:class I glutamine amidotransferase-like protein [Tothia fuscella]|uniref:Class I glutamine amidotransferase-like protein n=1 Tax=Tothia fuscella TaxID=1048955 RepID=A0A9P4P3Y2_9PEZI|nr:class I glutamine amidotransferase-like protein [Tothia fuscella]